MPFNEIKPPSAYEIQKIFDKPITFDEIIAKVIQTAPPEFLEVRNKEFWSLLL